MKKAEWDYHHPEHPEKTWKNNTWGWSKLFVFLFSYLTAESKNEVLYLHRPYMDHWFLCQIPIIYLFWRGLHYCSQYWNNTNMENGYSNQMEAIESLHWLPLSSLYFIFIDKTERGNEESAVCACLFLVLGHWIRRRWGNIKSGRLLQTAASCL